MESNTNLTSTRLGRAHEVTTFSKYLALTLFILLPFVGGYIGYQYGKASVTSVANSNLAPIVAEMPAVEEPLETTFEEVTDFYSITTVVPNETKDTKNVMGEYVENLVKTKQEEWKIGGEAYQAEAQVTADFPDRPKVTYVLDVRYSSTSSMKLGTVSYVFSISEMTGGANGNVAITTFTFDKNGQVSIESILNFADNNDIALSQLLAGVAPKQTPEAFLLLDQLQEGLGIAYLKSDGVTLDKELCRCDGFFFGSNFQNFSVTDTGLTFTFSKFAIAPGAVSTPSISLTWAQLAPYLNQSFAEGLALD